MVNSIASLSFEYRFKLNLIVTDYAGDAGAIMVALTVWESPPVRFGKKFPKDGNMDKKKSPTELYKDIFTKNLGQRLEEMSNSERIVYWSFVIGGIITMILLVIFLG